MQVIGETYAEDQPRVIESDFLGADVLTVPEAVEASSFLEANRDPRTIRTPGGHINNCSLANGDAEEGCQICGGSCPDRGLFREHLRSIRRGLKPQNREISKQDYATPWEFIRAVEAKWGPMTFDLAASEENAKAPAFFDEAADSLSKDWNRLPPGNLWLNPPFKRIEPWAAKCAKTITSLAGKKIFFLTPASVGSEWFFEHVHERALVQPLRGRIAFVGESDPYPKDLMLSVFGGVVRFDPWRWK